MSARTLFISGPPHDIGIPIESVPVVIDDFDRAAESSEMLLAVAKSPD